MKDKQLKSLNTDNQQETDKPNKNKLTELYVDKKLTLWEISQIFNTKYEIVVSWFEEFGVKFLPKTKKYELIINIPPTKEQREFIIGSVLGESRISVNKKNIPRIEFWEKDWDISLWKKTFLGNYINTISKRTKKKSDFWYFNTSYNTFFSNLRKLLYENNKKIVKKELINQFSNLSLAVMWVDLGVQKKYNVRLYTSKFDYEEHKILKDILKIRFNIHSKVCEYRDVERKKYYISLNKENSLLLADIVNKVVPSSKVIRLLND